MVNYRIGWYVQYFILAVCFSLRNMTGIEYMLLHVQEPILYVIRKVDRQTKDRGTCYSLKLTAGQSFVGWGGRDRVKLCNVIHALVTLGE